MSNIHIKHSKYECSGDASGVYAVLGYYARNSNNRLVYYMKNWRDCEATRAADAGKDCYPWCGWNNGCCFWGFPCSGVCGCPCDRVVCGRQNEPVSRVALVFPFHCTFLFQQPLYTKLTALAVRSWSSVRLLGASTAGPGLGFPKLCMQKYANTAPFDKCHSPSPACAHCRTATLKAETSEMSRSSHQMPSVIRALMV
jgi:hypothetical protein